MTDDEVMRLLIERLFLSNMEFSRLIKSALPMEEAIITNKTKKANYTALQCIMEERPELVPSSGYPSSLI